MSEQQPADSSTIVKLETAKQKKESGDQAFKQGDVKAALLSYHQALMFLLGLDKNALQSIGIGSPAPPQKDKDGKEIKEKTEVCDALSTTSISWSDVHDRRSQVDEIIEKIYANMCACHVKTGNWKRVVDTADKALSKNEDNYKVLFRKAKALGEQGFHEKAVNILQDIKKKNPADAAIYESELARLNAIDNERNKVHRQKLKGFLNREKKTTDKADEEDDKLVAIPQPTPAKIEEVS
ncbi:hypothetical protein H0H92_015091 [Tricholoma furcatifolium]|nr:hypothetical protein H0H92_015091 [Tricholoma furcatifolium]